MESIRIDTETKPGIINALEGKQVHRLIVKKGTLDIDNVYRLLFTDGTWLEWGYEDSEGLTEYVRR